MPRARDVLNRAVSEDQLADTLVQYAHSRRWLFYHTHNSRYSSAGFPDWCLVRPPRVVFVELKSERGKLSDAQEEWYAALSQCGEGVEVYLWKPSDWDTILEVLR